jgi:2-aminoadipate transaminase
MMTPMPPETPPPAVALAGRTAAVRSSAIRDLLALTQRPEVISLAGGLPAPDSFPLDAVRAAIDDVLTRAPTAALQYSTTEGDPALRAWIAARAADERGRMVDAADVLVTHGSQQALDLLGKVLVEPGTVVAIDEPGYVGAIQALSVYEPELEPIPVDRDGLVVEHLAERLSEGLRPRLVYTVVNFQNPTGATLAADRRRRLAELADRYGFVVVEDDPYGSLRFAGEVVPSIAAWTDRVVSLGTVSKLVVPGFRVGWLIAPDWLREPLARMKQAADLHTSSFGQAVLAAVLADPRFLSAHVEELVTLYGTRAAALADALDRHLGDRLSFHLPDGGMFLWARLGPGPSARELFAAATRNDVAFVPGDAFYTGPPDPSALRLSYATATPERLDEAARRLAVALDTLG